MVIILLVIIIFSRQERIKALEEIWGFFVLDFGGWSGVAVPSRSVHARLRSQTKKTEKVRTNPPLNQDGNSAFWPSRGFIPYFWVLGRLLFHFFLFMIVAQIKKSKTHLCFTTISFSALELFCLTMKLSWYTLFSRVIVGTPLGNRTSSSEEQDRYGSVYKCQVNSGQCSVINVDGSGKSNFIS